MKIDTARITNGCFFFANLYASTASHTSVNDGTTNSKRLKKYNNVSLNSTSLEAFSQ